MDSMTGFGRGEEQGPNFKALVEVKSVNHRFRDIRLRISPPLSSLEREIHKAIEGRFKRGSFDIWVSHKTQGPSSQGGMDSQKIKDYLTHIKALCEEVGVPLHAFAGDFLGGQFAVEVSGEKEKEVAALVRKALDKALSSLGESRRREGLALCELLGRHLENYASHLAPIRAKAQDFGPIIREKLMEKCRRFGQSLPGEEDAGFHREVIYYLEKMDIDEEIGRIEGHLATLKDLLKRPGPKGREMDFLIQELGRETNTIGQKSELGQISKAIVQMKVQLEKMREQALNME
ncbi:MAG: YicC family protein [Bacteriovoracales bacterium]|nr:YicC family protein [Bacteriovoracales bacterium]